jgi:CRP-like cAMP-binding protein
MVPLETLNNLRFLQELPDEYLQYISSVADLKEFPAGGTVFREGQSSPFIYIVVQGTISLNINVPGRGTVQLQTIGPGELLGWTPWLQQGPMTATARALAISKLLALNAGQIQAYCSHNPSFGWELTRRTAEALASRLAQTRMHLLDVFREQMPVVPEQGGQE